MNRIAPPLATATAVAVAVIGSASNGCAQQPARGIVRPVGRPPPPAGAPVGAVGSPAGACALVAVAAQGQTVAGAGSLQTQAWGNPACLARTGAMAFVAGIAGGRS